MFGLGLSIVKKTLELLKYDISVKNVKNGVNFIIKWENKKINYSFLFSLFCIDSKPKYPLNVLYSPCAPIKVNNPTHNAYIMLEL